ncbi:MAG: NAD-dependent epimerase/dehydratase family protein [Clostridia bacterium]|nr:NAD-dependent epimerase/dehydratase family protein [Clostridia bacterium]
MVKMLENNQKYISALKSVAGTDYSELNNKSILVTGSTGLIGKALVDYILLLSDTVKVYAASRSEESFNKRFCKRDNLFYFNYSLEEPLKTDISFDYIIHAASNADPKMFASDPVGTMVSNFTGTYNLLEYARKNKAERFLFVSSGEVYGQWDGEVEAFNEDYSGVVNFTEARGCYPSGKRAAENLCVCYTAQYGVDTVIVRPSHTYGPTQLKGDSRAMSEFFNCATEGRDIVLKSLGLPVRSYTCVFDCVSGIVTALLKGECGCAYNIANKESVVSIATLAEKIAATAGKKVVFDIPQGGVKGASNITRGVLNGEKLEGIGWTPLYDIDKGIKTTYEIMREEYE